MFHREGITVKQTLATAALAIAIAATGLTACHNKSSSSTTPSTPAATATVPPIAQQIVPNPLPSLTVTSTTFTAGSVLPNSSIYNSFGCTGDDQSPQLSWTAGPAGTVSYAVTIFDPDAPTNVGFWHWLVYNIPATTTTLAANIPPTGVAGGAGVLPAGASQAMDDYGVQGYGGPCPPLGGGTHTYIFTVTALGTTITGLNAATTDAALLQFNMDGNILARGQLIGLYGR
jgi:Raf kinase inhibitor-like YbhB/YbcL family protein